ncbi:MAG: GHKL domain-containing protein [Bdellovibrionales bacterium]|nr:GHKL domain-containing protein [Bdellovibrionales bacterium]
MNKKIAFPLMLVISILITSLFFLISFRQNQVLVSKVTDEFLEQVIEELGAMVNGVKNELLQSNIRAARNQLARLSSGKDIISYEIEQSAPPKHTQLKVANGQSGFDIMIPVTFSDDGIAWGTVNFKISNKKLVTLAEELNRNLLKTSVFLWLFLMIVLFGLYSFIVYSSGQLNSHMRKSFMSDKPQVLKGSTYKLFTPLVESIYRTGNELSLKRSEVENLKNQEQLFKLSKRISHDIRSPIGALNVMIQSSKNLSADEKKFLQKTANRINEVADSVLQDSGPQHLQTLSAPEIISIIESIVDEKRVLGHPISISSAQIPIGTFATSSVGLKNILSNLLNNAYEAGSQGSPIFVRAIGEAHGIFISVEDKGMGMDQELIQKVLKGDFSTKQGGYGIGLSSSKNIVESWGGDLSVTSQPGQGTTVKIYLRQKT